MVLTSWGKATPLMLSTFLLYMHTDVESSHLQLLPVQACMSLARLLCMKGMFEAELVVQAVSATSCISAVIWAWCDCYQKGVHTHR